jgi:glucose-1-phosphate cytidylyltransferase
VHPITNGSVRINGGYFVFKKDIFKYIRDGEELVIEPFQRLIAENQLIGYNYDGFWAGMDTFKDRQELESLWGSGHAPWYVWRLNGNAKEEAKQGAPAPVAEFLDRRSAAGNGITGSRKPMRH